jgi:serine/threonine protein phosphatase 1
MIFQTKPERFLDEKTIKRVEAITLKFLGDTIPPGETLPFEEFVEVKPVKTYAIGDIHGVDEMLLRLLEYITVSATPNRLVFTGDYVDRGPNSAGVIAIIRLLEEIMGTQLVIPLMGNHEEMLIQEFRDNGYIWTDGHMFPKGIASTAKSFINANPECVKRNKKDFVLGAIMPDDVFKWLKCLRDFYEDEKHMFVHGGLFEGPPADSTRHEKLWIREPFLQSDYDWGKHVFHGHTPRTTLEIKKNRTNLDTGAVFSDGWLTAAEIDPNETYASCFYQVDDKRERILFWEKAEA